MKTWSEIITKSEDELLEYFSIEQISLLEDIFFSQISILNGDVPEFGIEFVGFGAYVSREFLKKNRIEECYENFRIV